MLGTKLEENRSLETDFVLILQMSVTLVGKIPEHCVKQKIGLARSLGIEMSEEALITDLRERYCVSQLLSFSYFPYVYMTESFTFFFLFSLCLHEQNSETRNWAQGSGFLVF